VAGSSLHGFPILSSQNSPRQKVQRKIRENCRLLPNTQRTDASK